MTLNDIDLAPLVSEFMNVRDGTGEKGRVAIVAARP